MKAAYLLMGETGSFSMNADERQIPLALAQAYDLTVFVPAGASIPEELRRSAVIRRITVPLRNGMVTRIGLLKYTVAVWWVLRRNPVVVCFSAHGMITYLVGFVLSFFCPHRWIMFCWDPPMLTSRTTRSGLGRFFVACGDWAFRMFVRRCDLMVLNIHIDLLRFLGVSESVISSKVVNLPNGVSPDLLRYEATEQGLSHVVGVVANAVELKGFHYVLEGFLKAAVRDDGLMLKWIGACSEEARSFAVRAFDRAGIDSIRFVSTGVLPFSESTRHTLQCGICIYPYRDVPNYRWNYALKVPEYMALGRCVVAVDLPGIREYVKNDVTGVLVPVNDTEVLAERLVELANNECRQRELGNNARVFITDYVWSNITDKMIRSIDECLAQKVR